MKWVPEAGHRSQHPGGDRSPNSLLEDSALKRKQIYTWCSNALDHIPHSKALGASMGPIWGRRDPGGPHVVPINLAIWDWYQLDCGNQFKWWHLIYFGINHNRLLYATNNEVGTFRRISQHRHYKILSTILYFVSYTHIIFIFDFQIYWYEVKL